MRALSPLVRCLFGVHHTAGPWCCSRSVSISLSRMPALTWLCCSVLTPTQSCSYFHNTSAQSDRQHSTQKTALASCPSLCKCVGSYRASCCGVSRSTNLLCWDPGPLQETRHLPLGPHQRQEPGDEVTHGRCPLPGSAFLSCKCSLDICKHTRCVQVMGPEAKDCLSQSLWQERWVHTL